MTDRVKVAGVQFSPQLMEPARNLDLCVRATREAADQGAKLVVFPECALTGYCFNSLEEALPFGEPVPGPATAALHKLCRELGVTVVVGMLELAGGRLYNAAAVVAPQGVLASYRKVHLPYLGVDRFVAPGDRQFQALATEAGVLGVHICYDVQFPESTRVMALQGAEILVLPTNWPGNRNKVPEFIVPARAMENHVNFVAVNRVGTERGFKFIGKSKVVDPLGNTLAEAPGPEPQTIYAEVSLEEARSKRMVFRAGEFEIDPIHDRRPEFYQDLAGPGLKTVQPWPA